MKTLLLSAKKNKKSMHFENEHNVSKRRQSVRTFFSPKLSFLVNLVPELKRISTIFENFTSGQNFIQSGERF